MKIDLHFTFRMALFSVFSCLCFLGCGGDTSGKATQLTKIDDVPDSAWQSLGSKKILFGHQSVGDDMLNGVRDLLKEHEQIRLRVVETRDPSAFSSPIFAHFHVGKNTDPQSKMADFSASLENGLAGKVDIALLKLCFIDVLPNTDVQKVFDDYKAAFAKLKTEFPNVQFIHSTVPLTSEGRGLQAWIKTVKDLVKLALGKLNLFDNAKRNQINELLRKEYEGKEPFFDLAKFEASVPEGDSFVFPNESYSLNPDYTDDGGHLNKLGRKIVAEQLLVLMAQMAEKS